MFDAQCPAHATVINLYHNPAITETPALLPNQPAPRQPSPGAAQRGDPLKQRRLQRDLQAASDGHEFDLYYQPRLSLRTGRHTSTDATIRWTHRKRGVVPAGNFIGLAEAAGLGTDIGGWMLRAACVQAATWNGTQNVSVRVATCQLSERALPRQLAAALEASGLAPERLELGLSESTLLSDDLDLLLTLSAIRDLGVGIAVEDFGQTYASLSMLRRLPITALRLDRSLLRAVPDDQEDAAIVRAIVQAAHAMGLTVAADGIEYEAQRAFLSACGCDEGAGALLSNPLPEARLRHLGYA